jgi:outer membrane protein TolC
MARSSLLAGAVASPTTLSLLVFPVVVLCASATAGAQERGRSLGLREAVVLAARNNPSLAAAVADVAIADANATAAAGVDDWLWDANAAWNRTRVPYLPGTPVEQTKGDELQVSTALTRPLPSGGAVGVRVSTDVFAGEYVSDSGSGAQTSTVTYQAPSLQIFASHPLLRGAGADVARAQRHRAAIVRDAAALERDAAAASLVREVVVAYWETRIASDELAILDELTESARQQLAAVQAAISAEKSPPSAAAEVKVAVALRRDAAYSAEQSLLAQSAELARLLGVEVDPEGARWETTDRPDVVPGSRVSFEVALASALDHNPRIAAVRAMGRASAIDVNVRENGLLPELDLSLSGETLGNASDAATALGQLAGFRAYGVQVGLVFQEAVGRHAAAGSLRAARERLHRTRLDEAAVAGQIRSAVLREVGAVESAARRIDALTDATDTAALDLAAERARFDVGRATNFDVLRRQGDLAQTRLRLLRARTDYVEAIADLEALTGGILPRYGVTVR